MSETRQRPILGNTDIRGVCWQVVLEDQAQFRSPKHFNIISLNKKAKDSH